MSRTLTLCGLVSLASLSVTTAQQFVVDQPPPLALAQPGFDFFARAGVDDFDGDGDNDVALAAFLGPRVLRNDGAGQFVDVASSLPPVSGSFAQTQLFVDIDGDERIHLGAARARN
jgi:hypothetical protein